MPQTTELAGRAFALTISALLLLTSGACDERRGPLEPAPPAGAAVQSPSIESRAGDPAGMRDYYIVRLHDQVGDVPSTAQRLAHAHGGRVGYVYVRATRGFSIRVPAAAAAAIAQDPSVRSVRPVQAMHFDDVQSAAPWNLDRIDQTSLPLNGTYEYRGTGSNYTAYVFDTGIRTTHVEFGGRATSGWTVPDGLGDIDCFGHGTHVAGSIGGATYGVAKQVRLVSLRVFGYSGCVGQDADFLAAVEWLIVNRRLPAVANMSLTFEGIVPEADEAVNNLIASGVAVVIAAGNSGLDACTQSPARVSAAVTVAASDVNDQRSIWSFFSGSNYGRCVDLFAPGTDVLSALNTSNTASAYKSGTSMAAPHVAGAIAYTQEAVPSDGVARVLANTTPNRIANAGTGTPNQLLNVEMAASCGAEPCAGTSADPRFDGLDVAGPYAGAEGSPVSFAIVGAADPTVTYEWNFGDHTTASGPSVTHTYAGSARYYVTLTARDATDPTIFASRAAIATIANVAPTVSAGPDALGIAGVAITLRGSFSDPGLNDGLWSYRVDWGDGGSSSGSVAAQGALPAASHAYAVAGTYAVTLSVTDKDGGRGADAAALVVAANLPPVAAANGPYVGNEGTNVQFSSAGSVDPNGETLTYRWTFGDGTISTLANPPKKYADDGAYDVTLTVKDGSGRSSVSTTTATISNVAPTASFAAPGAPLEGTEYNISLSGSDLGAVDRATLEYQLDCGQGEGWTAWSTLVKSVVCPAVPDQTTLTVRGQVRDKDGAATTFSKQINVTNAAPVATFVPTSATTIEPGTTVTVEGSFTDKGVNDAPWTYTINWGDGSAYASGAVDEQGAPIPQSHTYVKPGVWSATLTVKDKDGKISNTTRITVTVDNDPPTASANGPYAGAEGTGIQFLSSGSSDPDGDVLKYRWTFGDGTSSTLANPVKAYADNGTYDVSLAVTDPSGAIASATVTATTTNVAPTAGFGATSATEGVSYTLTLSGSDAGAADRATLEYSLDCGQGEGWTSWSLVKSVVCPALPDQTTFTVRGQLRDKDGAVTAYSRQQTITNATPQPTLSATSPTSISIGGSLAVQGSFTDKGAADGPWSYDLNWGDSSGYSLGTVDSQGTAIVLSHVYARSGTFNVVLSVRDKDGSRGSSARVAVVVAP